MSKEYNQHKENQILSDIHNAASKVEIPDSVKPENMMQYIASKKSEGYFEGVNNIQGQMERARKKKIRKITVGVGAVAAALAIVIGVSVVSDNTKVRTLRDLQNNLMLENEEGVYVLSSYKDLATYTVAEDSKYKLLSFGDIIDGFFSGGMMGSSSSSKGDISLDWGPVGDMEEDSFGGVTGDNLTAPGNEGEEDYSDTNSRTEGVGEADVVKSDGKYIYYIRNMISDNDIVIVKADGIDSKNVCTIDLDTDIKSMTSDNGSMYADIQARDLLVYDDKIVVIITYEERYWSLTANPNNPHATVSNLNTRYYTGILVYDVSDIEKPQNMSTLYVEGEYSSCKYVDGYVYLFTEFSKYIDVEHDSYTEEEAKQMFAPIICGEYMDCADIYIAQAEDYNYYNIITSIDINNPTAFVDTKAVLGDSGNCNIYVSNNNIYIISNMYNEYITYLGSGKNTGSIVAANKAEIVRISYDAGMFETTGRAEIAGELGDEFDIDEYNGYLRMAVSKKEDKVYYSMEKYGYYNGKDWITASDWAVENSYYTDDDSSVMYVLDDNLELVGEITLEEEEEVYGVRFDGDIAYVVTYRQTDPLFAVDLSDPAKPKVMSALKIPGFSQYLHVWDENTLLGLGYDQYRNVKISTYDISDKYDIKEIFVQSLEDTYSSPALYDHRAVFISPAKNLLGFVCEGYYFDMNGKGYGGEYRIFEYADGTFNPVIYYPMDYTYDYAKYIRAMYIGEYIYLVDANAGVYVFSMADYSNVASIQY